MSEKYEHKGLWWLPQKPKKRILGTLKLIYGEGAILDLEGLLGDIFKIIKQPIILGESNTGEYITLHNCFFIKGHSAPVGFGDTSTFRVESVFIGAHFRKPEDIKFRSVLVHYSHLNEWLGLLGPVHRISKTPKGTEALIKCDIPEPIKITKMDDYDLSIVIKAPLEIVFQREGSIKIKAYWGVKPLKENSYKGFLKTITGIQKFLSLAIGIPIYPLIIEGLEKNNKYPPVEIYYRLSDITLSQQRIAPYEMLFTFKDISDKIGALIRSWFQKAALLDMVLNHYFSRIFSVYQYLADTFLSFVFALETYHRLAFGNQELPQEEHDKQIKAIINASPTEYKSWLKNKLAYSNEPTLRKRLKDIFSKYSVVTNHLIVNEKSFIDKVLKLRTYLVHGERKTKKQTVKGEGLDEITQRLRSLIEICLLTEIGFTSDEIKNIFSRNRRYKYIKSRIDEKKNFKKTK